MKTVLSAIQHGRLERLTRVVKSLVENKHIHTLIFHWFGNYTLQDLVTATSKLRVATIALLDKAKVCQLITIKVKDQICIAHNRMSSFTMGCFAYRATPQAAYFGNQVFS